MAPMRRARQKELVMRLTLMLFVIASVLALSVASASAAGVPVGGVGATAQTERQVDQHDDSRVGVQLVVAGIAAGLVVGVGTGAYLLRRKLGLTAYTPDQSAGGHH